MASNLLSLLIFTPFVFLLFLLFIPERKNILYKYVTLASTGIQFILSLIIYSEFRYKDDTLVGVNREEQFQFVEKADWIDLKLGSIGNLSIDYFVGIDGLSVYMLLLSSLVLMLGAVASWTINKNTKGYFALYLLLSSTIIGCFASLDFFLFYLFFEFMLLPMYFLIGMWGGPRREYASIKFFLYTLFGSLFILIAMLGLYFSVIDPVATGLNMGLPGKLGQEEIIRKVQENLKTGSMMKSDLVHTFNMLYMMDSSNFIPGSILSLATDWKVWNMPVRLLAFLALFIGFIIKLPSVPLHTWLPDAHVEAPTPISVVLAGILLKIGAYGILRTAYSIFPEGAVYFAWMIGFLGVLSIIYGAFNALAMKDLKRMIAYSSVSHMGFVLLGMASLTSEGVNGALFQMFSHGLLASMLFLIAGVLYDRTSDRDIEKYKGLASRMPGYTVVVAVAFFASLGLPGFSGFIAELFVLLGAFNAESVNGLIPRWMAVLATAGILLGAVYYLWTLQRMFFGRFWISSQIKYESPIHDLTGREKAMFVPLIILTLAFGIFPGLFFDIASPSVAHFTDFVFKTGTSNLEVLKDLY